MSQVAIHTYLTSSLSKLVTMKKQAIISSWHHFLAMRGMHWRNVFSKQIMTVKDKRNEMG